MNKGYALKARVLELSNVAVRIRGLGVLTKKRASRLSIRKWELLEEYSKIAYRREYWKDTFYQHASEEACGWCVYQGHTWDSLDDVNYCEDCIVNLICFEDGEFRIISPTEMLGELRTLDATLKELGDGVE